MNYKITDLIEPDNGCEGFMPGEEPMVTLILSDENRNEEKSAAVGYACVSAQMGRRNNSDK